MKRAREGDWLGTLYTQHIALLQKAAEEALTASGADALLIHASAPHTYFADDQDAPFRTNPAFAHFVPLLGPHHLLCIEPSKKPFLVRVTPDDYWREQETSQEEFWNEEFDIKEVKSAEEAWKYVPKKKLVFIGEPEKEALAHGIAPEAVNSASAVSHLNWRRSFKTEYEAACIDEANHSAAHAHRAARDAFFAGASELEIHYAYVDELGVVDRELPYESIVALDEKAAILHYQNKRLIEKGKVLLLDAGASYLGYASDITRTSVIEEECDVLFRGLLGGMEKLQQELCFFAKPGVSFSELHNLAHIKIGDLLHEIGVLALSGDDAAHKGITSAFFPHGLGHFLGIQVHDVGGNQEGKRGGTVSPPENYPKLRMTRTIEEGMVFTVEPGIYFIDMLLKPYREGKDAAYFNWELIERLAPMGGIRIEDDILATREGSENLTRRYLP